MAEDFVVDIPVTSEGRKLPPGTGCTMLDWTRFCMSIPAPKKLRGISKEEVMKHDKKYDMWMVIGGKVYDVTLFTKYHPGGIDILMPCAGRDATTMYNKYHKWVQVDELMAKFCIGYYDPSLTYEDPPPYSPAPTPSPQLNGPPKTRFSQAVAPRRGMPLKKWNKGEPLTMDIIETSRTRERCWVVIFGKVYDVTEFLDTHPGGEEILLKHAGTDCSKPFNDYHSGKAKDMLKDWYLGDVARSSASLLTPGWGASSPPPKPDPHHTVTLLSRTPVTHDTDRFVFSAPSAPPPLAGHVSIRTADGAARSYTPIHVTEEEFHFVIKKYEKGTVSRAIHALSVGDKVSMRSPLSGPFTYVAGEVGTLCLAAGGTGVAPFVKLVQQAAKDGVECYLLCVNKEERDALLGEADLLKGVEAEKERVHLRNIYTREDGRGHVTEEECRAFFPPPAHDKPPTEAVVCGPPGFNLSVGAILRDIGYHTTLM